jgi:CRP-like cAMP-binding protein
MSMTIGAAASPPRNQLLAQLSPDEWRDLRPLVTTVSIGDRETLHRQHEPRDRVYFPNDGMVSVTVGTHGGALVEVATIGVEGLVGVEEIFGPCRGLTETMVQVPGTTAESLSGADFRTMLARSSTFHRAVAQYAQVFLQVGMQSSACLALHEVSERCSKWLLLVQDRVGRDEFELTQEFLAMMLAVARPTVTGTARLLQRAGLIDYRYGRITIVDRQGLEESACECYAITRQLYAGLVGPPVR